MKCIAWSTDTECRQLAELNRVVTEEGISQGLPSLEDDIAVCETIMQLAPETNGEVAVKAWAALGQATGRDHGHLAEGKEEEKIRFRDVAAQPRKIISSPVWSGLESEKVCYNAGYTNVHGLIRWRTCSGRQSLYLDHHWMRAFGEGFVTWRPPIDTKTVLQVIGKLPNGNREIMLNILTPHQKWGIHSTYSDTGPMLTLSRGGPIVWLCEEEAKAAGIRDNDWIEAVNRNGVVVARAIVTHRMPEGTVFMYHAKDRVVDVPRSELTGRRGGIHNSLTRILIKPSHIIGGYAQLAYFFNYIGPTGNNRDEGTLIRRLSNQDVED